MADDPHNPQHRLERHAEQPVPPVDPGFANRLESQLRIDHAAATSQRPWAVRSVIPRLAVAAVLVVVGVAGIVSLTSNDAGVPVAVVDDEQSAALDAPALDDDTLPTDVTVTATPTPVDSPDINEAPAAPAPVVPTATATPEAAPAVTVAPATTPPEAPNAEPTTAALVPNPIPTSLPTQSTVPLPTATPAEVPPTSVPIDPTVLPVPTATVLPEPSATATPELRPTPTPTPEIEQVPIELTCAARSAGDTTNDAVGVVCSWAPPVTDRTVAWYEVLRSRNGAEVEIVARQRGDAATSFVDRNLVSGDEATYLVQAVTADDQVVGASVRKIVQVP